MWSQNNISTLTKRKKPNAGAAFDSSTPMATDTINHVCQVVGKQ